MDLVDIIDWRSHETKTIEITQTFLHAPQPIEVREFVPVEGDMLEEQWTDGAVMKRHRTPPYALADMKKTAQTMRFFLDRSIIAYVKGAIGHLDPLLWSTYQMAIVHSQEAQVSLESNILLVFDR